MNIDWLQIITIIIGSGVVSAFLTGFWLNNRTEKLKAQLQQNIFEFQTRFSLLHQKQAEVIENLFELLADFFNHLQKLANWENILNAENAKNASSEAQVLDFYSTSKERLEKLIDYFDKKRLYLDKEIQKETVDLIKSSLIIIKPEVFSDIMKEPIESLMNDVTFSMDKLEKRFKKILSAGISNHQLEKK